MSDPCLDALNQFDQMRDRAFKAEAAIARVQELHGRHDPNCPYGEDCAGAGLCLACREEYPCATIRALVAVLRALDGDGDA